MGNCCKSNRKLNNSDTIRTVKQELYLTCKSPEFSLTLPYEPLVPISKLTESPRSLFPHLDISQFSLHKGNIEILDEEAEVKDLGIKPEDQLKLKPKQPRNIRIPSFGTECADLYTEEEPISSILQENRNEQIKEENNEFPSELGIFLTAPDITLDLDLTFEITFADEEILEIYDEKIYPINYQLNN